MRRHRDSERVRLLRGSAVAVIILSDRAGAGLHPKGRRHRIMFLRVPTFPTPNQWGNLPPVSAAPVRDELVYLWMEDRQVGPPFRFTED